jgi:hypothetical protein
MWRKKHGMVSLGAASYCATVDSKIPHRLGQLRRVSLHSSAISQSYLQRTNYRVACLVNHCSVLERRRLPAWFPQCRGNATSSSSEKP